MSYFTGYIGIIVDVCLLITAIILKNALKEDNNDA